MDPVSRTAAITIACRWLHNNAKWNFGRFNTDIDLELFPLFDFQFPLPDDWDSSAKIRVKESLKEYKKGIWKDALTEMQKDSSLAEKAAETLRKFITANVNPNNVVPGSLNVADVSQNNSSAWNSGSRKRSRSESPPTASASKRKGNEAGHATPDVESPVPPPAYRPSTPKPTGTNVLPPSPLHSSKQLFASQEILDRRRAFGNNDGVAGVCSGGNSTEPNAPHSQPKDREPGLEPSYTSPDPSGMFREFDSIPPCCIGCTEHPQTRPMSEQMSPHDPTRADIEQMSSPARAETPAIPESACGCAAEVRHLKDQMAECGRKVELIIKLLSLQRQAEKTLSALQGLTDGPA
ncbi:hypothetical protein BGX38DRAFT_1183310 [Terfezia claveryi]|nr:hypothetical protein BGX38DRAFT_1183310 [Terfezia claveryi]